MTTKGPSFYQIGNVPDGPRSVLVYFMAIVYLEKVLLFWVNKDKLSNLAHKPQNTAKYNAAIYVSNNCVQHRQVAVDQIANVMTVHYTGNCQGTNPNISFAPEPLPLVWNDNDEYYRNYKFCIALENTKKKSYITEKILLAFLGGCIPIYYGSEQVFDIFNKQAFVYFNISSPQPALDRLKLLSTNETAYMEMLRNEPILVDGTNTLDKYFSLSNGIGNGSLKRRIRDTMGLPVATAGIRRWDEQKTRKGTGLLSSWMM